MPSRSAAGLGMVSVAWSVVKAMVGWAAVPQPRLADGFDVAGELEIAGGCGGDAGVTEVLSGFVRGERSDFPRRREGFASAGVRAKETDATSAP